MGGGNGGCPLIRACSLIRSKKRERRSVVYLPCCFTACFGAPFLLRVVCRCTGELLCGGGAVASRPGELLCGAVTQLVLETPLGQHLLHVDSDGLARLQGDGGETPLDLVMTSTGELAVQNGAHLRCRSPCRRSLETGRFFNED